MPIPPLQRARSPRAWRASRDRWPPSPRRPAAPSATALKRRPGNGLRAKLTRYFFAACLIGGTAALGALLWLSRGLPSPDKIIDRPTPVSTKIYDRAGTTALYELYAEEKRTPVTLADIPQNLKWATIVREDRAFYAHQGISLRGILRSAFRYVVNLGPAGGGGSTLTQQFVKNAALTNEKTFTRKIKEVVLTWRLERAFTKDQILELYLNEIPYGGTAYGVEAAAQTFFGKSARDVTLAEAATLAVIPKAPTYYSPYGTHTKELFNAQHYLLDQMAQEGYVSEADAEAAKTIAVKFKPIKNAIIAPHFVMYVRELLTERFGEVRVQQGGLRVQTTLDLALQRAAEAAVTEGAKTNEKNWKATNAALVSLNPKNGDILAMVGSRDYFDTAHDGNFNVTLAPRQPGSSFKPIVYATLFSLGGYTPDTVLFDVDTVFKTDSGKDYAPKDYDGKERGPLSIRKAFAGSLNTPAVKAIYLAGIDRVLDQAERLGYTTLSDRSRFGLSLVLGGGEVRLLEHLAAVAALGQGGVYHPPVAILEVKDANGKTIWKPDAQEGIDAVPRQAALQAVDIMRDNDARTFMFGARSPLQLGDRPVAAKTGTTNDFKDAWTVGFTPSLAAGVWVGNNDFTAMKKGADGSVVAAPLWNAFMKKALEGKPNEEFEKPEPWQTPHKPMFNGRVEGDTVVRIDRASGKLATDLTPASFITEYRTGAVHNILHYVNREDPAGPAPAHPADDWQYENWESAVQRWAQANGFTPSSITPPADYDDVHTEANRPSLTVTAPASGTTVGDQVQMAAEASALRGINRIEASMEGRILATLRAAPYTAAVPLSGLSNGNYTLTITAFDDIDNSRTVTIPLRVEKSAAAASVVWLKPIPGAALTSSEFPQPVVFTVSHAEEIKKADVYLRAASGQTEFLGVTLAGGGRFTLVWGDPPSPGAYKLFTVLTTQDNSTVEGNTIEVTIAP